MRSVGKAGSVARACGSALMAYSISCVATLAASPTGVASAAAGAEAPPGERGRRRGRLGGGGGSGTRAPVSAAAGAQEGLPRLAAEGPALAVWDEHRLEDAPRHRAAAEEWRRRRGGLSGRLRVDGEGRETVACWSRRARAARVLSLRRRRRWGAAGACVGGGRPSGQQQLGALSIGRAATPEAAARPRQPPRPSRPASSQPSVLKVEDEQQVHQPGGCSQRRWAASRRSPPAPARTALASTSTALRTALTGRRARVGGPPPPLGSAGASPAPPPAVEGSTVRSGRGREDRCRRSGGQRVRDAPHRGAP